MFKPILSWKKYWGSATALGTIILVITLSATIPVGVQGQVTRGPQVRNPEMVIGPHTSEDRGPLVYAPEALAFGRTYAEWSAAWWQWAFSIPVSSHPLFDNGDCSVGQSGPVWFLGGKVCQSGPNAPPCIPGVANRTCAVPHGKGLYFPLSNIEDSASEEPNFGCGNIGPLAAGTIAEMRQCIATYFNGNGLALRIDGSPVHNLLERFHVQSVAFGYTLTENNFLEGIGEVAPAGTYFPSVDEGVYVMLAPLSPGPHVIHFTGGGGDITYNLVVSH